MYARRSCPAILMREAPSACFVVDEAWLARNCAILEEVQSRTHVRILLALKAFSAWKLFPKLSRAYSGVLYGTCASSVHEARLGYELFGGEVHAFACAWDESEMKELLPLVDHISFNSLAQWRRFAPMIAEYCATHEHPIACGIRINPEHSEGTTEIYDPCAKGSRLGVRKSHFDENVFAEGISGLHMHTLCEQGADALVRTFQACKQKFASALAQCRWINLGGGHHITRCDYDRKLLISFLQDLEQHSQAQIYLEPGEAVALDAGFLTATVLDVVWADLPVAILDVSPTCHMPDTLEMPYLPPLYYEHDGDICEATQSEDGLAEGAYVVRLAGKSCLAGDVLPGTYGLNRVLNVGDRLVFGDMAIYSMVKTNTFNGLNLPSIALLRENQIHVLRSFGYEDFVTRLS